MTQGAPEEASTSQASRVSFLVPFLVLIVLRSLSLLAISPPSCVQFDFLRYPNFWRSQPLCLASKLFSSQLPDANLDFQSSSRPYNCYSGFLHGPFPFPICQDQTSILLVLISIHDCVCKSSCIYSLSPYKHPAYTKDAQVYIYAHSNTFKLGRAPRKKPTASQQGGCCYDRIMQNVSGHREGS